MENPPDVLWHPESSGRGHDKGYHFPDRWKNKDSIGRLDRVQHVLLIGNSDVTFKVKYNRGCSRGCILLLCILPGPDASRMRNDY